MWSSRDALLGDPQVNVVGYQVCFEDPLDGLFMFNHLTCGTTFAVLARSFADLYVGPIYTESHYGDEDCLGLCDDSEALDFCPNTCLYAGVRAALQAVRSWPKRPLPTP
ncbi:MAG: hypothetical protein KAI47_05110 [Deltaproteobacteria bacterium]|nr:hypothetical protein [Deltaproteobacteria bacterium]